jgi:hypothetical protein
MLGGELCSTDCCTVVRLERGRSSGCSGCRLLAVISELLRSLADAEVPYGMSISFSAPDWCRILVAQPFTGEDGRVCSHVEAVVLLATRLVFGSEASAKRWSAYRDHVPLTSGPTRRYDVKLSWATLDPNACPKVAVPLAGKPSARLSEPRLSPGILGATTLVSRRQLRYAHIEDGAPLSNRHCSFIWEWRTP